VANISTAPRATYSTSFSLLDAVEDTGGAICIAIGIAASVWTGSMCVVLGQGCADQQREL
jgi:hypothetical protein